MDVKVTRIRRVSVLLIIRLILRRQAPDSVAGLLCRCRMYGDCDISQMQSTCGIEGTVRGTGMCRRRADCTVRRGRHNAGLCLAVEAEGFVLDEGFWAAVEQEAEGLPDGIRLAGPVDVKGR